MKRFFSAVLALLCAAVLPTIVATPAYADQVVSEAVYKADLIALNDSGAVGTARVAVSSTGAVAVQIEATGLNLDGPHAMHVHGKLDDGSVSPSVCPTAADDADADGILTVLEGAPRYGGVLASLTTTGDTSGDSALAIDRFPAGTSYSYARSGMTFAPGVAANMGNFHIVVHGIDENGNGQLDLDQTERSSLTDDLPREGTAPALCGELVPTTVRTWVNTTADSTDVSPGDGQCADSSGACSLRAAVQEANAAPGSAVIFLDGAASYSLSLAGSGEDAGLTGDIDVTSKVKIRARGAKLDLGELDRAFDVSSDGNLRVEKLHVRNGSPADTESGGAYRNLGRLELVKGSVWYSDVSGAGASGGAVFNSGWFKATGTLLKKNTATRAGGAIEALGGHTMLIRVRMDDNVTGPTPGNGGGLHLTGEGRVVVRNSIVTDNLASAEGGGLWNSATGTMVVRDSYIARNRAAGTEADQGGGGVFNDGGTLTVIKSDVYNNRAVHGSGSGGGLLNNAGTVAITGSVFKYNDAARAGGGVEARDGSTSLTRVRLDDNATGPRPGNGGGLHLTGAGTVTLNKSRVTDNVASNEGGGLWNSGTGTMTVTGGLTERNRAPLGADNFNVGGTFTIDGVAVTPGV
jgi:CSLREA domain-containing protein